MSGGEKGKRRAMLDVSSAPPLGDGVQGQRQGGQQPLALAEGQVVELAQGGGEVGLRPLGHLLERRLVLRVKGDGERGVEEPLPAPLHLVPETGDVLQGDLRLRGHGAAPLEGEGLRRLEAHLLPLQRPAPPARWESGRRGRTRSIGAPAAISPWRKPGARDRGHLPRWRERTRVPPMRMSRRPDLHLDGSRPRRTRRAMPPRAELRRRAASAAGGP